jgi:hypothetical protein
MPWFGQRLRFGAASEPGQHRSQVLHHGDVVRLARQGSAIRLFGQRRIAVALVDHGQRVVGRGVGRAARHCGARPPVGVN